MTTKEWLNRGYRIDSEIKQLMQERENAFAMATNTVVGSGAEKVQTSKSNSSEVRFINYAAYDDEIYNHIDELYKIKHEIVNVIWKVENRTLRLLLFMRYVRFMKWEAIAEAMGYSNYHVVARLHPQALTAVERIINEKFFKKKK